MSCCSQKSNSSACNCASNKKTWISQELILIISAISIVASLILGYFDVELPLHPFSDPSWIAIFLCGYPILSSSIDNLLEKRITSSLLVSIAILAAIFLQFFEGMKHLDLCSNKYILVAGEIAFLMSIGEWIEHKTLKKSRAGIESLRKLMPEVATLKSGKEIAIKDLKIGDVFCVLQNTLIAMDAQVVAGESQVDESSITGESMPVDKKLDSNVYAGTMNLSGYLELKVTKLASDSQVSKMAKLVEEASGKTAPISRYVDKWASKIIPTTIALAIITFFASKYIFNISSLDALVRAVTILVVFCPCAFVLATPTAIAAALGNCAKKGLLIKSGATIEKLAEVKSIFFDKTGTITKGEIKVDSIVYFEDFQEEYVLELAAIAEKLSQHPIAKAIYKYVGKEVENPQQIEQSISKGIEALCKGHKIKMQALQNQNFLKAGLSCIEMHIDSKLAALFYLSDSIRESSKESIEALHSIGLNCTMLSGDNNLVVEKVAKEVGLSSFRGELLAHDKLDIIKTAQKDKKVCMVGDGVNDAPALAQADTSIAIASLKNSVAIETAEASIVGQDLNLVHFSIMISRRAMRVIKLNICFAIIWNLIALSLAFFGIINPVIGVIMHNFSSIFVVLNSSNILLYKSKKA